jgi:hypothetical protein
MSDHPLHDEYPIPINGYNSVHHYLEAKCLPYPDHLLQCLTAKELQAVGTYSNLQSEQDHAAFLLEAFRWYISDYYGYRIPEQRVFDATLANRLVALYKQGGFPVRCVLPHSALTDADRRKLRRTALELKFKHPDCLKTLIVSTPEEILRYPSGIHMLAIRNRTLRNTVVAGLKEKNMDSDPYGYAIRLAKWSRVTPELLTWYKRQVVDSWKALRKLHPTPADVFETQELLAQLYGSWVRKIQIIGCVEPIEVVARIWVPVLAQERIPPQLARICRN